MPRISSLRSLESRTRPSLAVLRLTGVVFRVDLRGVCFCEAREDFTGAFDFACDFVARDFFATTTFSS